ncbi:hypothetical protein M569_02612 [Genlisea aurea]|uniref:Uncharacterized protein n=1 Tax=Genlisea aurea TaxID=192259 RepID=S8EHG5_9LAMI|nr:hypothetical protein M569_02612 [Genlisea aurea]
MDDTNKKKKNKKKKNKNANRPTENVAPNEREFITGTQSNASEALQDSGSEVSLNTDANREGHLSNGTATNLNKNEGKYCLDREAGFQEKIKQLHSEKDTLEQREVSQKQIIQQLRDEKYESVQNEASLRGIITQLNKEKDELMQKQKSAKESIMSLHDENTRLQNQVIELEKSRDSLREENQHLMGIISSLELLKGSADNQIPSEKITDVNQHIDIEAAKPVEQKPPIPENPEMVMMMGLSGSSQSLEDVMLEDERDGGGGILHSEIEEIGGNHSTLASKESSSRQDDDDDMTVPLSDAPLIGAPFRLISFVARYVSGADLVDKSSLRRG